MTKAQKWAARAATANGAASVHAPVAAPAAAPTPTTETAAAPTAAAAAAPAVTTPGAAPAQGSSEEVAQLKKALEDMRKEMLLHQHSHQQERADLTAKLEEATKVAKEKAEAEKVDGGGKQQMFAGLNKVENPLNVAKKGFGWLSHEACKMARVETPEDIKRRKKFEEHQRLQQEAQEKQDSARESVSSCQM